MYSLIFIFHYLKKKIKYVNVLYHTFLLPTSKILVYNIVILHNVNKINFTHFMERSTNCSVY